ncbi:unnamed protein product [Coregonus sp. 'balchen']|nr:unnamed protein product [Coregonus sp. 'balchen']
MKMIWVFLVSQLASCVSAQTIGCNNTVHADGTTTYQLSEPLPGSPSTCVRQWLDANMSFREAECLKHNICFGDWCVSEITFGLAFGISAAVIIIILVLLIRYKILIYRVCVFVRSWVNGSTREPSPDPEKSQTHPAPAPIVKYSPVNQQATVIV